MTKSELIKKVAEKFLEPRRKISPIVKSLFDSISSSLAKGEKCMIAGFGVFKIKDRAARKGRNPQDPSQTVLIPARKVLAFRPGKRLQEKVQVLKKIKEK
jgi:DNA-binding protein HU-beta